MAFLNWRHQAKALIDTNSLGKRIGGFASAETGNEEPHIVLHRGQGSAATVIMGEESPLEHRPGAEHE